MIIVHDDPIHLNDIINQPKDGIFVIDNFFSEENCAQLIKEIDLYAKYDEKDILHTTNVKAKVIKCNLIGTSLKQYMLEKISKITSHFRKNYNIPCVKSEQLCLRKIYGNTRLHVDHINGMYGPSRCLSIIIALNGDYEGGEFVFPVQGRKIKLKQGQLIAFPPYWTHPHYTNDLENATFRYTVNTWLLQDIS